MNCNHAHLCLFLFVLTIGLVNISCEGSGTASGETILEPIQPVFVSSAPAHAIGG